MICEPTTDHEHISNFKKKIRTFRKKIKQKTCWNHRKQWLLLCFCGTVHRRTKIEIFCLFRIFLNFFLIKCWVDRMKSMEEKYWKMSAGQNQGDDYDNLFYLWLTSKIRNENDLYGRNERIRGWIFFYIVQTRQEITRKCLLNANKLISHWLRKELSIRKYRIKCELFLS